MHQKVINTLWGFEPTSNLARSFMVREAFDITRRALGQVPFKHSHIGDAHIRELVDEASKKTGISTDELDARIQKEVEQIEEFKKYSFVLYDTLAKNVIEQAVFDLADHVADKLEQEGRRQTFDLAIFFKLIQMVELEHEQFFPLRAPGEHNYIFHMDPIVVPNNDPKLKKWNGVDTAAATANGDFIFNKPFMQKLLDFAVVEKLHPQGKKYQSNGGPIPDAYSYIEFLIVHELLHYTYGDFAAGKRLGQYSPKEHNWASDFRSNYMLVKNGYDQLPIGLFSDHINYDRQNSYDAMVKLVHDELAKLPKPLQDKFEKMSDLDEHGEPGGGEPSQGQPGESQPGESKPGESKPGDAKPGQAAPSQDDIHKDVENKMGKRKEIGSDQEVQDAEKSKQNSKAAQGPGQAGSPGKSGMSDLESRANEIANIKPRMPWRALLRKMLSSSASALSPSYAKPARRSVTGITVAARLGAAAVKPGEKVIEEKHNKVCLVFDTSGSMWDNVPRILKEAQTLLGLLGKSKFPVGVIFFAGYAEYYEINLGANTWVKVNSAQDMGKTMPKNANRNYMELLSKGASGGTDFSSTLASNLTQLASQGYNIMIFSDSDMFAPHNWERLSELWSKHKANVFFVAESVETWKQAVQKLGQVPGTWTHL
jgi:Putative metallopeptidase domain